MTTKPLRSSKREILEDVESWKKEMAIRHGRENAWQEYAGDSFAEIAAFTGEKEMERRRLLIDAGIDPYTGDLLED